MKLIRKIYVFLPGIALLCSVILISCDPGGNDIGTGSNHTIRLANVTVGSWACPIQLTGLTLFSEADSTLLSEYSFVSNPVYTSDNYFDIKIKLPEDVGTYRLLISGSRAGEYIYWSAIAMSSNSSTEVVVYYDPNYDHYYGRAASINEDISTLVCK